ncbi:MAG: tetratricopeptide repeat protein [Deltaproteobacteria bacterium]|nr:tetratricopeptide repeat protein [Deltaproteobacteria bacterium]
MSIPARLAEIRELRADGKSGQYVTEACRLADTARAHAGAQLEAAYACDEVGDDQRAVDYFDSAWQLGVPDEEHARAVTTYGALLKNLGRIDEAVAILGEALLRHPSYPPVKAMLALALHAGKFHNAAMATAVELVLEVTRPEQLDGFGAALAQYQTELTAASLQRA